MTNEEVIQAVRAIRDTLQFAVCSCQPGVRCPRCLAIDQCELIDGDADA